MTADRKKPGVTVWTTVVVVCVPLLYVLSYGPACRLIARGSLPDRWESLVGRIYEPVRWTMLNAPALISEPLFWYSSLWL